MVALPLQELQDAGVEVGTRSVQVRVWQVTTGIDEENQIYRQKQGVQNHQLKDVSTR